MEYKRKRSTLRYRLTGMQHRKMLSECMLPSVHPTWHIYLSGEAQGDKTNLYFFAGNMYLKMWSNASGDVSEELQAIGKALAGRLDADAGYPSVIRLFPAEGQVPYSAAYITSNFIGHEFLRAVYTVKYEKKGRLSSCLYWTAVLLPGLKYIDPVYGFHQTGG